MKLTKAVLQSSGLVAANGTCTITFPIVPLGLVWTGSITITNAPIGSVWNVENTGSPFDIMSGAYTVANLQAIGGEQITLVGSGLLAGTTMQATWVYKSEDDVSAELVLPAHDSINPQASYTRLVSNKTLSVSGTIIGIPLTATDRAVMVLIEAGAGNYINSCIGQTTGVDYYNITKPLVEVSTLNQLGNESTGPYIIPVPGALETAINLTVTLTAPATVLVYAVPDIYPGLNYQEPLNVAIFDTNVTGAVPYSVFKASPATATTVSLLAAPAAGFWWEIAQMCIWQTTAGAAAGGVTIKGHTSGSEYLVLALAAAAPNNIGSITSGAKFMVNEAVDTQNTGTGVPGNAIVLARQVPITFSGPT